jgi:large subunit ribosomal protein L23
MKTLHDVILRPLILTEKGELLKEEQNKIFFEVAMAANKIEVKHAVERLFNVKVLDVHTLVVRGKPGRMGKHQVKRPNWKKAIVTLKEGDTIEFFEGI